jgi:uncharacterized protein YjdB
MVRQPWCVCAVVLLLAIAGCGGKDDLGPRTPASIRVVPTAPRLIVRDSVQLTATVVDAAGDPIEDQPLTFTSSFPALFTVSPTGLVTSLGYAGQAQIAVTSGQLTAIIDVLAVLPPSAIYVYQAALTLQPGQQLQLQVTVTDDQGERIFAPVGYRSTDVNVVAIDAGGYVTAVGNGQAAIVVSSPDRADVDVPVTVRQVPRAVQVTPTSVVIEPGGQQQLSAEVVDTFFRPMPGQPISYVSDAPAVATVSDSGLVRGVVAGSAVVTVQSGSLSVRVGVFVGTPPPGDILATVSLPGFPWGARARGDRYFVTSDGQLFGGQGPGFGFPFALAIGDEVFDVEVNAAATRAYVAAIAPPEGPHIAVVDLTTGTVIDRLPGTGTDTVRSVALSPDESQLFVGTGSGVERIDLATGAAAIVGGVTGGVTAFSRHPTAPLLYGNMGDTSVVEIDTQRGSAVRIFTLPPESCCDHIFKGTAVAPDGSRLYAVLDASHLVSWDLASGAPGPRLDWGGGVGLALSPDGKLLYIGRSGAVLIVDRASFAVLRTVQVGGFAVRVAVRSDGVAVAANTGYVSFIK